MGEKISNGGWEDGFTDWVQSNFTLSNAAPHGGTWSIWSYSTVGICTQTLNNPVPVSLVQTFTIWTKPTDFAGATPIFKLRVRYTDTSSTEDSINMGTKDIWNEIDLEPYLVAGKTIEEIEIEYSNTNWRGHFDDFSLYQYDKGLNNLGGTVALRILRWSETQSWDVARRRVPLRTGGEIVDKSHYLLNPKVITLVLRLTDAQKTTLEAIIDQNAFCTFLCPCEIWFYDQVWVEAKTTYVHKVVDGALSHWEVTIKLTVQSGGKV